MENSVKSGNEEKKAGHPKQWIVYIGKSMEENYDVGKAKGIWGFTEGRFKLKKTIGEIQAGDTVMFFGPTIGCVPGFTPRLPEEKFLKLAKKTKHLKISEASVFKIKGNYQDEVLSAWLECREYYPVWPDEDSKNRKYPHRFWFDKKPVKKFRNIPVGKLSRDTIDILRRVMISSPGSVESPLYTKIMDEFSQAGEV